MPAPLKFDGLRLLDVGFIRRSSRRSTAWSSMPSVQSAGETHEVVTALYGRGNLAAQQAERPLGLIARQAN